MARTLVRIVFVGVALSACGECRVDGASDAVLIDSLDDMSRTLDSVELRRFEDAILAITQYELSRQDAAGDRHRGLAEYLNGLTYDELIAYPAKLGAQRPTEVAVERR